jgi:ArsR family transcriptional regulator, zinc-responsive transcriptional repressor
MAKHDIGQLTSIFKLLSDKTRLQILVLLREGERNVTELCKLMELPQPTVSHHLALLRTSGVIGQRRSGKQVFYSLSSDLQSDSPEAMQLLVDGFDVSVSRAAKHDKPIMDGHGLTSGHGSMGGSSVRPVSAR